MKRLPILCLALALLAAAVPAHLSAQDAGQAANQPPRCTDMEEHRQFDFWIGDWEVVDRNGKRLGENTISRPEHECMLLEKWTSATGGEGTSLNYFDPATESWVQYWVAATWMLNLEGGLEDGEMVMEGESRRIDRPGESFPMRGIWTPLEDGRVRQVFQRRDAETGDWTTMFEGFYVREDS